jgi:hypothetical protein
MTRLLVPELGARRHPRGYAQFPDVPEDVTNLWKAPFGPPEEWDLCVAEQTIDGPVPVRVYLPTGPAPDGGPRLPGVDARGAFAWGDRNMAEAHEVARGIAGRVYQQWLTATLAERNTSVTEAVTSVLSCLDPCAYLRHAGLTDEVIDLARSRLTTV